VIFQDHLILLSLLFDYKHWTFSVAQGPLGDTAEQEPLQPCSTVASHDDHGSPGFLGLARKGACRVIGHQDETAVFPRLEAVSPHEFLETLLSVLRKISCKEKNISSGG
jgi:hypothetical protein